MRKLFIWLLAIALFLISTFASAEVLHVNKSLSSPFLTLDLDADVVVPNSEAKMTVYVTDHPTIDAESWARMFSDDIECSVDTVERSGSDYLVRYGDMIARYFYDEARLYVCYSTKETSMWWDQAQKDTQAEGISTTPQQAINIAQKWIEKIGETLGWDGYVYSACYAMPANVEGVMPRQAMDLERNGESIDAKGYYIVEYERDLDGYHVAYDKSPYVDETLAFFLDGDHIQLCIDDDGILWVKGFCRSFIAKQIESVQISLDEAIGILEENMDYVKFYPNETSCTISEIQLCYRLVQTLPTSDANSCVCTEARPVWRFATRINRFESDVFFIFIDAITGEVIP